jgi:hypothetical protein
MEAKILVLYIGVAGIRSEDIPEYTHRVAEKVIPSTFQGEVIILPTQSLYIPDARIECINPVYITEPELIKEHVEMMKKLQHELQAQLKLLKEKKNE